MNGLYIEYNIRGHDGRIYPNVVMTSEQFGQETFNDLAGNGKLGSVVVDTDINGHNRQFDLSAARYISSPIDVPVKYDRAFVILP